MWKICVSAQTDFQGASVSFDEDANPIRLHSVVLLEMIIGDRLMLLDTSTLYLVATLVAAMLGLMLLFFGRQEKIAALNWWGVAYLLGAASTALWTLAGPLLGETLTLAFNAVGFIACGLVWTAARVFHGRAPNWAGLFAGAAAWLVAVLVLQSETSSIRITVGAGIIAIYAALTAAELWTERRKSMQRRWPTMLVPLLHGLVLMLPVVIGDLVATDQKPFERSAWAAIFAIELVLYAIGTVFVIFLLVSERTLRAHKAAASIDPLTGLFNRRGFAEATAKMIAREEKASRTVTVMIFDIDHFKSINDNFGHPAGDEILKLFSSVVTQSLRANDLSGRIGGEEFAAMLPCSIEDAVIAADRVRLTLHRVALPSMTRPWRRRSASASRADRLAPRSTCCWSLPTRRSIRPSARAAIGPKPRRICRQASPITNGWMRTRLRRRASQMSSAARRSSANCKSDF
jgi:diguanylate cyclase (GGDEF)-like protein